MFIKTRQYAILFLRWYMPEGYVKQGYGTPPPDGRFTIWSCCIPWPCDIDYNSFFPERPTGYMANIMITDFSTRKFSAKTKAKIRKDRLINRATKKMPLFANQMIEKVIESKPDYFDYEEIEKSDIQQQKEIDDFIENRDKRWID